MEAIWSITAISRRRSGRVLATLRKEAEEEEMGGWERKERKHMERKEDG